MPSLILAYDFYLMIPLIVTLLTISYAFFYLTFPLDKVKAHARSSDRARIRKKRMMNSSEAIEKHKILEDGTCSACKCCKNSESATEKTDNSFKGSPSVADKNVPDKPFTYEFDIGNIVSNIRKILEENERKDSKLYAFRKRKMKDAQEDDPVELSMGNAKILSRILGFIDLADLKTARLVNSNWNKQASAIFVKRARFIPPKSIESSLTYLHDIIEREEDVRYENFKLLIYDKYSYPYYRNFLNVYGSHIKDLILQRNDKNQIPSAIRFNRGDLRKLLEQQCPNLVSFRAFFPNDDFHTIPDAGRIFSQKTTSLKLQCLTIEVENGITQSLLKDLLGGCPDLKSFNIAPSTIVLPQYAQTVLQIIMNSVNLSNLNHLSFGKTTPLNDFAISLFKSHPWKLSYLKIVLGKDLKEQTLKCMLNRLSATLETFIVEDYDSAKDCSLKFPIMKKLTTFEMKTDNNAKFLGPLQTIFNCSDLKALRLYCTPVLMSSHVHLGSGVDFGWMWRMLNFNAMKMPCLPSLQTLQIPYGLTNSGVFLQISSVFPNVKDLTIHHPSEDVIGAIFIGYTKLERLKILLVTYYWNIDHLLTGLKESWIKTMLEKMKFKFVNADKVKFEYPGLKEMKNLKYLEIRCKDSSFFISDATLYNGLMHLTNARHLKLQGCKFSQEGLEELSDALGPLCHIEINKPNGTCKAPDKCAQNANFFNDRKKFGDY